MGDQIAAPGPAIRGSLGRHPRDGARLVLSAGIVALCALIALKESINPVETVIFRQIALLPSWSIWFWTGVMWMGSVAAIGGSAALAFFFKLARLGIKLVLGGVFTWGMVNVTEWVVGARPVPARIFNDPHTHLTAAAGGFAFPAERTALAAALATIASPYLAEWMGKLVWPGVVLVALADVLVGGHLPVDVVAGAFLGWGTGTLLHLVFGAPGRRTSPESVTRLLRKAGIDAADIAQLRGSFFRPALYEVTTGEAERLMVEIVRRGQRRAGAVYKMRRFIASLEVEDEPRLSTPRHEVEHEAFVTLLAEREGVRTPHVVLAREVGHGPAVLVTKKIEGRTLAEIGAEGLNDELMDELWRQVGMLGKARIAHHDLRLCNILVDPKGLPWLLDFTLARAGSSEARVGQDVAEVMLGLAGVAGSRRAVETACRALSKGELEAALPFINTFALPRRIRKEFDDRRYLIPELRLALADEISREPPSFRSRIRPSTILSLVVGGGAVYLVLPQIGTLPSLVKAIEGANYWWLGAAFVAGAATFPAAAASYMGAVQNELPLGRTTLVQVASAFTSRTTPGGIGGIGVNAIYLERRGIERAAAFGAVALNQTAGAVVHAVLFFAAVAVLGTSRAIGKVPLPTGWPVLAGAVAVLVATGIIVGSSFGRRRVLRPTMRVTKELWQTLRHPRRACALLGGSAGVTLGNGLALAASLAAFGTDFSLPTVVAVYVAGAALAAPAPTPGNLGAVEAALVAGLTGVGIASTPAVAAVLTFRLLTFWLPIGPGLASFRYLQHRGIV